MNYLRQNMLWIIATFSALMFILGLIYNMFIPPGISFLLGILGFLFIVVSRKKFSRIMKTVFSIVFLLFSTFLFYTQYSAERMINYNPTETNIITFVVRKDSVLTSINDTNGKIFGVSAMSDSTTKLYLRDQVSKKVKDFTWTENSDDPTNLDQLYEGKIDIMLLDNSIRDYLIEENPDFETKTKIIWTIEKSSIKEVIVKEVDVSEKPFIVLISGIDTKGPITLRSRSDVNILMIVNPTTNSILTISIPRDTFVPLGCKNGAFDKLTHSGIYGINCTVKTIEDLVGIDINYYIRLNFTSFLNIINVIGNINVYSKYSFTTSGGYSYIAGMNSLNAKYALYFARERHSFASGDIQRGLNQQEVIKGIISKLLQPTSLMKIERIINATKNSVDTNLSIPYLSKLIKKQIENNKPWMITTSNLSGKGDMQPTYSMGSQLLYVMHHDLNSLIRIQKNIADFMVVAK